MVCFPDGYMSFKLLPSSEMAEPSQIGGIDIGGDSPTIVGSWWLNESGEIEGGGTPKFAGFTRGEKVPLYGVKLGAGIPPLSGAWVAKKLGLEYSDGEGAVVAGPRIDPQVRPDRAQHVGLLRDRAEDVGVVILRLVLVLGDVEARWMLQHLHGLEVNRTRHTAAALSLVARPTHHHGLMGSNAPLGFLEHAHVRLRKVRLRGRPGGRRHGGRHGQGVELVERRSRGRVAVDESFQADQLGQLAAQHLRVSTEVMRQYPGSLEVLGEVVDLDEGRRGRRVHVEQRGMQKLDRDAAQLVAALDIVEVDVLDVRERVLDLVTGLVVVDVVGHGALVGRVEDDQVHRVLADTHPPTDGEGAAVEMVDH